MTITNTKRKTKFINSKNNEINVWTGIDFSNQGLVNLTESLFEMIHLKELYISNNNIERIPDEIFWLEELEILDISCNKLKYIPEVLGRMVTLKSVNLSYNYISSCPMNLGFLHMTEEFILDGNPLIEPFGSIYLTQGGLGLINFCRENNTYPGPMDRTWIDVSNLKGELVSVATFNILGQKFVTSNIYKYVPNWALDWNYRKKLIFNEIQKVGSDILAVQEIESFAFSEYLRDKLEQACNYDVLYYPQICTTNEYDENDSRGCAIFWKKHRFSLIDHKCVEFTKIALQDERFKEREDVINRNADKSNIALITVLEKFTGGLIIVVNTHLFWNPEYPDVKLFQTIILCEELKKYKEKYEDAAIILAGDFNSTKSSSVYELLTLGKIFPFNPDFLIYNYSPYTIKGYIHNLKLKDSYKDKDLPFTNYNSTFKGVLDYIFHNDSLILMSYLAPLDSDYVNKIVGLPSIHLPSDHILIGARFVIKNKKKFAIK